MKKRMHKNFEKERVQRQLDCKKAQKPIHGYTDDEQRMLRFLMEK